MPFSWIEATRPSRFSCFEPMTGFLPRNQLFDINQCSTFRHFLSPYAADAVTAGVTTRSSMAIFWAIVSCASGLWVTTTVW